MSTTKAVLQVKTTFTELNDLIIDSIQDIKGKNIIKLDLRGLEERPTDFFIICEGESTTQVKAISNNLHKRVKEEFGIMPNHHEGTEGSQWILVDYFDTIIHIFHPEKREYYDIEDLWSDAEMTQYDDL